MADTNLPPCGIYKTTDPIGSIPPDSFVYFHNHGDPGPGVYPPAKWIQNRAVFREKGVPLSNELQAKGLIPLPPEGFYRVRQALKPNPNSQTVFQPGQLVQIGYNSRAETILFVPQLGANGLEIPSRGIIIQPENMRFLEYLLVAQAPDDPSKILH